MDILEIESAIQKYSEAVADQGTIVDNLNQQKQKLLDQHQSIRQLSGFSSNHLMRQYSRLGSYQNVERPPELNQIDQQITETTNKIQSEALRLSGLEATLTDYKRQLSHAQQAFEPDTPSARVLNRVGHRFAPK